MINKVTHQELSNSTFLFWRSISILPKKQFINMGLLQCFLWGTSFILFGYFKVGHGQACVQTINSYIVSEGVCSSSGLSIEAQLNPANTVDHVYCCHIYAAKHFLKLTDPWSFDPLTQDLTSVCALNTLLSTCIAGRSGCPAEWNTWFLSNSYSYMSSRKFLCDGGNVRPELQYAAAYPASYVADCLKNDATYSPGVNECLEIATIRTQLQVAISTNNMNIFEPHVKAALVDWSHCILDTPATTCTVGEKQSWATLSQLWFGYYGYQTNADMTNILPWFNRLNQIDLGQRIRCSVGVTGDPHFLRFCDDEPFDRVTCSAPGSHVYFQNSLIRVDGINTVINAGSRFTFLTDVDVQFISRFGGHIIAKYSASGGNVPKTFDNGLAVAGSGIDEILITTNSSTSVTITYPAAALYVDIASWNTNYFFTIRLSKSLLENSQDRLLNSCPASEIIDIQAQASRRRRRRGTATDPCLGVAPLLNVPCYSDVTQCTAMGLSGCEMMHHLMTGSLIRAPGLDDELRDAANAAVAPPTILPTTTTATTTSTTSKADSGLSTGAIIAISVSGAVAVVVTVLVFLQFFRSSSSRGRGRITERPRRSRDPYPRRRRTSRERSYRRGRRSDSRRRSATYPRRRRSYPRYPGPRRS